MNLLDLYSKDACPVCGQTPCNCTHLNEEKVRLDPKCWKGKKIGNPKTKVKGGVRVNNCVPAESVAEGSMKRIVGYRVVGTDIFIPVKDFEQDGRYYELRGYEFEPVWDDEQGVAEGMDDTVAFEIDSENAYNHVMKRFGSVIDWDGDAMVVPRRYWPAVQEVAHDAGGAATEYGTEGVKEAFIAPALSAANANAEHRRRGAAGGGYRGRIDIPVQSREDYISAGRALKKAAAAAGQKIEYGLSNGVMSVFSDSMDADTLDQFIDSVLEQGVAEGFDDVVKGVKRFVKGKPTKGERETHHSLNAIGSAQVPGNEKEVIKHINRYDKVKNLGKGVAEGDYNIRRDPTYQKYNPETHTMMYKDGKHKAVKHDQVAKAKSLGWKVRSSLKAFAKGQSVAEGDNPIDTEWYRKQQERQTRAKQKQGVAEGSISTYILNVMDEATGEHWAVEIQATSPDMAKERAQQQGYKVLRIKEKAVAETMKKAVPSKERDPGALATRSHISSQEQKHKDWAARQKQLQDEFYANHPELDDRNRVKENMADEFAKMAQKRFPNATIRKNGETVQQAPEYKPAPQDPAKLAQAWAQRYPNIDADIAAAKKDLDPNYEYAEGPAYYRGKAAQDRLTQLLAIKKIIDAGQPKEQSGLGFGENKEQEADYGDEYQSMVQRVGQQAREQEKTRPVDIQDLARRLRAIEQSKDDK